MISLDNWAIVSDPYHAPELNLRFLCGTVSNSSKHTDGKVITTSRLVHVYKNENNDIIAVTASGTNYKLGNPDPEYEKVFNNASQRLVDSHTSEVATIVDSGCFKRMLNEIRGKSITRKDLRNHPQVDKYESSVVDLCLAVLDKGNYCLVRNELVGDESVITYIG
jgi:hypothetical protein